MSVLWKTWVLIIFLVWLPVCKKERAVWWTNVDVCPWTGRCSKQSSHSVVWGPWNSGFLTLISPHPRPSRCVGLQLHPCHPLCWLRVMEIAVQNIWRTLCQERLFDAVVAFCQEAPRKCSAFHLPFAVGPHAAEHPKNWQPGKLCRQTP